MNKHNQYGFSHLLIPVIIVLAIITIGLFIFKPWQPLMSSLAIARLPACSDKAVFTAAPLKPDDYKNIAPLGNLNPPDHTLPTDHLYFNLLSAGTLTKQVPVYSPGNITITTVQSAAYGNSGHNTNNDYSIYFYSCKTLKGYFDHLSTLSSALESGLGHPSCSSYNINSGGATSVRHCAYSTAISVKAGTQIGTAGGRESTALDFGLVNQSKTLSFANPGRYISQTLHSVCPVDYFAAATKTALQRRLGNDGERRTAPPVCGQINQDKAGTLQGNWFSGKNIKDGPGKWHDELAIVHDNANPSLGVISVGGVIGQPMHWTFKPTRSGSWDREPSSVLPNNTLYCYDSNHNNYDSNGSKRLIMQLTGRTTLKIEEQQGRCGSTSYQFTGAAKTYYR